MSDIREQVRARYAEAATAAANDTNDAAAFQDCCGPDGCGDVRFGSRLYQDLEVEVVPESALLASLGCGNPTAVADLREGEVVLDLGSGGGIDVLLSAKRVGPTGKAYGLDMTDEMLELAEKNRAAAGVENVEFLKGYIEEVPLPDGAVDVVISNCVINLSADKPAVFSEMLRVLRRGGRIGITDVVAGNELTHEERSKRGSYVGCIAGALSFAEYERELANAGFDTISIVPSYQVADGMWSAIVTASKPR